jgi:hypothetical protein
MVGLAMQGLWLPLVVPIFLWAHKSEHLIASYDICERAIFVFRELFQQMLGDSYPTKFLLFCKEMGYPSGIYPSHFWITFVKWMGGSYRDTTAFRYIPSIRYIVIRMYTKKTADLEIEKSIES